MDSSENLPTIKQAAEFLSVSPMSLRRWTNSGRLKCYRVGLKNEHRIKRSDLEAFLVEDGGVTSQVIIN